MINTLLYTKKLEAVGLAREVAEAHVEMVNEIMDTNFATKQDLKELEYKLVIRLTAIMGAMFTLSISATAILIKVL